MKRLEGRSFALVGINSDRDKDEYHQNAEKMQVTWRSSWQGSTRGPIPTLWNVTAWPTIYVLDPEGVIRFKNVRGEAMTKAVDQLLADMKKQPDGRKEPHRNHD